MWGDCSSKGQAQIGSNGYKVITNKILYSYKKGMEIRHTLPFQGFRAHFCIDWFFVVVSQVYTFFGITLVLLLYPILILGVEES